MYVIQRADSQFYWKHQHFSLYYGYDSFDKVYLFSTEKVQSQESVMVVKGRNVKLNRLK